MMRGIWAQELEDEVFCADDAALESSFDIEARAIVGRSDRRERPRSKRATTKAVKRRVVQLKLKLDEVRSRLIVEQSKCADAAAELGNLNATVRALRDENARQRAERQHERFEARERRARVEGDLADGRQALGAARGEAMLLRAEVDELRQSRVERDAKFVALAKRHRAEIEAVRAEQELRTEASLAAQKDALEAAFAESNGDDISAVMELTHRQHSEELEAVRAELADVRREAGRAAEEARRSADERDAQVLEIEAVSSASIREAKAEAAAAIRAAEEAAALALHQATEEAAAAAQSATAKRLGGSWMQAIKAEQAQKIALEAQALEGRAAQRAALEAGHARAAALLVEHDAAAAQLHAANDSEATGAAASDAEALAAKVAAAAATHGAEAERLRAAAREAHVEDEAVARGERTTAQDAQEMQRERVTASQRASEALDATQRREAAAARAAAALAAAREAVVAPTAFTMRRPGGADAASRPPAPPGAGSPTVRPRRVETPGRSAGSRLDGRRWTGSAPNALYAAGPAAEPAAEPAAGGAPRFYSTFARSPRSTRELVSDVLSRGSRSESLAEMPHRREARRLVVGVSRAALDALRQLQRMCTRLQSGEQRPLVRSVVDARLKVVCGARSSFSRQLAALDRHRVALRRAPQPGLTQQVRRS